MLPALPIWRTEELVIPSIRSCPMEIVWVIFQFRLDHSIVSDIVFGRILNVWVIRIRRAYRVVGSGQIPGQERAGARVGFGDARRGDLDGIPELDDAAAADAKDFDIADDAWHGRNDSFAVGS